MSETATDHRTSPRDGTRTESIRISNPRRVYRVNVTSYHGSKTRAATFLMAAFSVSRQDAFSLLNPEADNQIDTCALHFWQMTVILEDAGYRVATEVVSEFPEDAPRPRCCEAALRELAAKKSDEEEGIHPF